MKHYYYLFSKDAQNRKTTARIEGNGDSTIPEEIREQISAFEQQGYTRVGDLDHPANWFSPWWEGGDNNE